MRRQSLRWQKHSLDEVALFVGILVEGMAALAGRVVGDDQGRTTVDQELLQAVAVAGGISSANVSRRERLKVAFHCPLNTT
jgi:hypothetical protein